MWYIQREREWRASERHIKWEQERYARKCCSCIKPDYTEWEGRWGSKRKGSERVWIGGGRWGRKGNRARAQEREMSARTLLSTHNRTVIYVCTCNISLYDNIHKPGTYRYSMMYACIQTNIHTYIHAWMNACIPVSCIRSNAAIHLSRWSNMSEKRPSICPTRPTWRPVLAYLSRFQQRFSEIVLQMVLEKVLKKILICQKRHTSLQVVTYASIISSMPVFSALEARVQTFFAL